MEKERVIAIDLGTTNCVVSIIGEDGKLLTIKNTLGEYITPSFIYFGDEIIVGKPAKDLLKTDKAIDVYHSYKPLMSTAKVLGKDKDNKPITPERCSTEMLKYLKKCVEETTGETYNKAVITVPAYFNEVQKYATKISAEEAGLEVIMLPTEPTAGAYYYTAEGKEKKLPMNILVYDFGGGTFDACLQTIVSLREVDVHMLDGDKHLGGDNVNIAIAEHLYKNFESLSEEEKRRAINYSNEAKIKLSNDYFNGKRRTVYSFTDNNIEYTLSCKDFLTILNPIITRTITIMENLLRNSPVKVSEIDEVLLLGGSTRLPLIREKMVQLLNDERFNMEYFNKYMADPDLAVGYGANRLIKEVLEYGEDVVTNALPIPIKIVINNTALETLFQENTNLPARRNTKVFNTSEGQSSVKITIVEDFNNKFTDSSVILGELEIDLPEVSTKAGEYVVYIRLVINNQGLLTAKASLSKSDSDDLPKFIPIPIIRKKLNNSNSENKDLNLNTGFGGK